MELGEGAALEAAIRGEIDGEAAGSDISGLVGGAANLTMYVETTFWLSLSVRLSRFAASSHARLV